MIEKQPQNRRTSDLGGDGRYWGSPEGQIEIRRGLRNGWTREQESWRRFRNAGAFVPLLVSYIGIKEIPSTRDRLIVDGAAVVSAIVFCVDCERKRRFYKANRMDTAEQALGIAQQNHLPVSRWIIEDLSLEDSDTHIQA